MAVSDAPTPSLNLGSEKFHTERRYVKKYSTKPDINPGYALVLRTPYTIAQYRMFPEQHNCATLSGGLMLVISPVELHWENCISHDVNLFHSIRAHNENNAKVPVPDDTLTMRTRHTPKTETGSVIRKSQLYGTISRAQSKF